MFASDLERNAEAIEMLADTPVSTRRVPCRNLSVKFCVVTCVMSLMALTLLFDLIRDMFEDNKLLPIIKELTHGWNKELTHGWNETCQ